ncbi:MAG: CheR family methyltransferase [Cyclobacteriaceae bacterium]
MEGAIPNIVETAERMKLSEFQQISQFITSEYGIKLPDFKKTMVEGRLQKRLRQTGITSFSQYIDFVFSVEGKSELLEMVDAISTNKTDFFRESSHFDFLSNRFLPKYSTESPREQLKIWSSAASSGEEIYTIAMVVEEFNSNPDNSRVNYSILGTDISVEKLKTAISAIYPIDRIKDVPIALRDKYLMKSKDSSKKIVRFVPQIRSKAEFQRLNLMDRSYNLNQDFDIVFCRNVLIYFDKEMQEKVINRLCTKLKPGGYFFLGHSESIIGKNVPLKQIEPTIYQKI